MLSARRREVASQRDSPRGFGFSDLFLKENYMGRRRFIRWLGAAGVAAAAIGCGPEAADTSTAKPGPAPAPPTDLQKQFAKPKNMPSTKGGGIR
jgi:hypothetical protein